MTIYKIPEMTAYAWAQPNIDPSVSDPDYLGSMPSQAGGLENPWFAITVEWTWPQDNFWSRLRIVRTIRSPARRIEEGQTMMETTPGAWEHTNPDTGNPIYQDPQPPPGEWTYYSIFCLDANRIWNYAGCAMEIGPADYDWTLRLPELLPGAAVSDAQGVTHPADQSNDLVQFLQTPAGYLDRAVTMAEAMQFFWDPEMCPPQCLPYLAQSWGFKYDESLGLGRIRALLAALRLPSQGSIPAINAVARAASGCETVTMVSNNLMLDVNDSSFESGDIYDTGWEPIQPGAIGTRLEIRGLAGTTPSPELPPNVLTGYFLYVPTGPRTLVCGYRTIYAPNGTVSSRVLDPVSNGIPVQGWTKMRMGLHAHHGLIPPGSPPAVTNTVAMGMDFYDNQGLFLRTLPVVAARTMSWAWAWYGNGDGKVGTPENPTDRDVAIPTDPIQHQPATALTSTAPWTAEGTPYEGPQTGIAVKDSTDGYGAGIHITWNTAAGTGTNGLALWRVTISNLVVGATYRFHMSAISGTNFATLPGAAAPAAQWRAAIYSVSGPAVYQAGSTVTPAAVLDTSEITWEATKTSVYFGIEALEGAGWSGAGQVRVTSLTVERQNSAHAYGVPTITVQDACCIDLIVVDDG